MASWYDSSYGQNVVVYGKEREPPNEWWLTDSWGVGSHSATETARARSASKSRWSDDSWRQNDVQRSSWGVSDSERTFQNTAHRTSYYGSTDGHGDSYANDHGVEQHQQMHVGPDHRTYSRQNFDAVVFRPKHGDVDRAAQHCGWTPRASSREPGKQPPQDPVRPPLRSASRDVARAHGDDDVAQQCEGRTIPQASEARSTLAVQGAHPADKWADGGFSMPPISLDGGRQEEFEEYWSYNNETPRRFEGGWIERRSHPQINVQPYWYNEATGELSWHRPDAAPIGPHASVVEDGLEELSGTGPEWDMSVKELKAALAAVGGVASSAGLRNVELARRAVATYEEFLPRVLSWHDYQYLTFWFFGGLSKETDRGRDKGAKSFFQGSASRELFAEDAFFHEAARVMMGRLHRMPPINLTYFIWTFARPKIVVPDFMEVVGHHFCEGRIQMFDRCSLGTMVWNYSNLGVRHDRFFNDCADELARPNRVRSLAPRNYQNSFIAYSRMQHWDERLFAAMAGGMIRLLDGHDPKSPKCARTLLFSYTCKDGSEVPADAFRIGSLSVIYKTFKQLGVTGPQFEKTVASFLYFARRSVERSPPFMREPGDACTLLLELARGVAERKGPDIAHMLAQEDLAALCYGAPDRTVDQLRHALRRAGLSTDAL